MTENAAATAPETGATTPAPLRPGSPRWARLVKKAIKLDADRSWFLGDCALEIAPMGEDHAHNDAVEALGQFAAEVAVEYGALRAYRQVASAWPKADRRADMTWSAHRILMGCQDLARPGITVREAEAAAASHREAQAVMAALAAGNPPPAPASSPAEPDVLPGGPREAVLVIPRCVLCDNGRAVIAVDVWGYPAFLCRMCARRAEETPDAAWHNPRRLAAAGADPALPDAAEAAEFLGRQQYTQARPEYRGRPQEAHEYVMARKSDDTWMALRTIEFIRQNGERRQYGANWYWYWTPEGSEHEYWSMLPGETVINRRRLGGTGDSAA